MTLLSHHEPERPALYDARKRRLDRLWLNGEIGNATYLRSLFVLDGITYTPDVANSELAMLRMEKTRRAVGERLG